MKKTDRMAAVVGLDVHRRFSTVTARNAERKIIWRRRLEHKDRHVLRKQLADWAGGTPVILESSFGWEWICEELEEAGLKPCLASSRKVAAWRDGRAKQIAGGRYGSPRKRCGIVGSGCGIG